MLTRRILLGGLISTHAFAANYEKLPDAIITESRGITAWLVDPTLRYAHGVLGDAIEAGGFVVMNNGKQLYYKLGENAVFEDRRVRLVDIDGDGKLEAIIIKSYLNRGACIAIYKIEAEKIVPFVESEAIGSPNRWLNIIGSDEFTQKGKITIAAVITPHLAGSLRLYEFKNNQLTEINRVNGYTNHIIGERNLDLFAIANLQHDTVKSIVIPTLDRQSLAVINFKNGKMNIKTSVKLPNKLRQITKLNNNQFNLTFDDKSQQKFIL